MYGLRAVSGNEINYGGKDEEELDFLVYLAKLSKEAPPHPAGFNGHLECLGEKKIGASCVASSKWVAQKP